ncbi:MAG: hypothetical protein Fur0012_13600 [Elusimicrobiota bacterium]
MREFHLFNIEEVAAETDSKLRDCFVKKTFRIFPRFLFCLSRGDCAVFPEKLDSEFSSYAFSTMGLSVNKESLFFLEKKSSPYFLCDSILLDDKISSTLKKMASRGLKLSAFIDTPKSIRLARELGISLTSERASGALSGRVLSANDKALFKKMCFEIGVPAIEGYEVESMAAAQKALKNLGSAGKVFLKKTLYGGGMDNLFGSAGDLLELLPSFYTGGRLLVEPYIEAESVFGTICEILPDKISYLGCDLQNFRSGSWNGFDFPGCSGGDAVFLKENSLKLARRLAADGVFGIANFDWLKEKGSGRIFALEVNLRNNGFYFLHSFANRYFPNTESLLISYREGLKSREKTFSAFRKKLSDRLEACRLHLIDKPGEKEGMLIVSWRGGEFAIASFSESLKRFEEMKKFIDREAL